MKVTLVFISLLLLTVSMFPNIKAKPSILSNLWRAVSNSSSIKENAIDPKFARTLLDNDFESGSMSPWYDESPGYVNWRVENFSSPSETNSTSPKPSTGTNYARATRNADIASGLAVLHSPTFTANPGLTFMKFHNNV